MKRRSWRGEMPSSRAACVVSNMESFLSGTGPKARPFEYGSDEVLSFKFIQVLLGAHPVASTILGGSFKQVHHLFEGIEIVRLMSRTSSRSEERRVGKEWRCARLA